MNFNNLLFCLLIFSIPATSHGDSGGFVDTLYPNEQAAIETFGERSDKTTTFQFEVKRNNELKTRLTFHVDHFPYQAKISLSNAQDLYEKLFRERVEKANKEKSIFTDPLTPISESVEVSIYEWMPGKFSTSLKVNRISGFKTTSVRNSNLVVVMASEQLHQSSGGLLSRESGERHLVEKNGNKVITTWEVVEDN